jgi:stearoyl-CoA desaturase (delta-9 desaturase)
MNTLRAIIRNRALLMKLYGRQVIKPVIQLEASRAQKEFRDLYQRARKFMIREDLKMNGSNQKLLDLAFAHNQTLQTVYLFKQQLKELWCSSATNQSRKLERLQQWCNEAEQSGIDVLREFARSLQKYSLQPAR